MSFWGELRRRKVVRVALAYAIVGWLLIQVADTVLPTFEAPGWTTQAFTFFVILGFPLALVLSWVFDLTPAGVKRTQPEAPELPAPASAPGSTQAKAVDVLSVAVLPFVNMSSDPEQEYFSDGLSEELLNQLAQIDELKVIGRTSSFAFKGRNVDLREIGEQLGAANLLEGSVRKAGDRLRITAQLIDAASGHHLWSETYDRRLVDVFAVQDEIARSVADALSITLGVGRSLAAGRPDDVQTYDLYLRARAQMHGFGPGDFLRGADLFRQALLRDPDYSRARAGLVHAAAFSTVYVPERRAEAERGLEQTVADAEARSLDDWATDLARAAVHMIHYEWAESEGAFARAEARAPTSVPELIELQSLILLQVGRVTAALELLQGSMASDPLSVNRSFEVQFALWMLGRDEEGEAEYERSLDLPGADAREDIHHMALFRAWNGGADAALVEARFDKYLSRQTIPVAWAREVRAVYTDREAALAVIRAAFADPANDDPVRLQFVAAYACQYGDPELTLAAWRRALVEGSGQSVSIVSNMWWPMMAPARRLPGYKDLVRDIGLVGYWRKTGNWGDFVRPVGADFECF